MVSVREEPRWPAGTPIAPGGHGPGGGRWAPAGAPGVPGGWASKLLESRDKLRHYLDRQDYRILREAGGAQGRVEFRQYPDGTILAYKRYRALGDQGQAYALAEQETADLAEAIGAPVPKAIVDPHNPTAVFMDYVEGSQLPVAQDRPGMIDSDAGRRLALLDILIGNMDRHSLNWIGTEDGPVGIDHGLAFPTFFNPRPTLGDFEHTILRWDLGTPVQFHYSRADLSRVRAQIESVQGKLRPDSYRFALDALDILVKMTPA